MKRFSLTIVLILIMSPLSFSNNIKDPNVSGQFYVNDTAELSAHIDVLMKSAKTFPSNKNIEMIISPHAAFVYSGIIAAYGFKQVSQKSYKTIIVIAPSHFYGLDGISIWQEGGFRTPLGIIDVDSDFTTKLIGLNDKFIFDKQAFDKEHSLEVQLPFLQKTFSDFKIVPVIMGQTTIELCEELAKSLNSLIGQREDVLIVISTDLSHYHDYDTAKKMDRNSIVGVKNLQAENVWKQCSVGTMEMCGLVPVTTAIYYAKLRGLNAEVLSYANSGDTGGDKTRVVGYTSIVFDSGKSGKVESTAKVQGVKPLSLEQKKELINIAKETITQYVKSGKSPKIKSDDPRFLESEGAFVTLHKNGKLRGCIGHIVTSAPLIETVQQMAISAASSDPRFKPVTEDELQSLDIEVSVLSKPRRIKDPNEVEVGKHGVIIKQGRFHKGVFLPQVATEWNWSREEFLSNLCSHKAGLPPDAWKDPQTEIEVFTADVFSEKEVEEE